MQRQEELCRTTAGGDANGREKLLRIKQMRMRMRRRQGTSEAHAGSPRECIAVHNFWLRNVEVTTYNSTQYSEFRILLSGGNFGYQQW